MKNPKWEAGKEVLRWVVSFVASWVLTEVLAQITKIPEFYRLDVSVFTFMIPVRGVVSFLGALGVRYLDKYRFIDSKNKTETRVDGQPQGLLWF